MAETPVCPEFLHEKNHHATKYFLDFVHLIRDSLLQDMGKHQAEPVYLAEDKYEKVKPMTHTMKSEGQPYICQRACGNLRYGERLDPLKMMSTIDRKEYRRYPPGNNPIKTYPSAQFYGETKHCQEMVESLKRIPKDAEAPTLSAEITEENEGSNEMVDIILKCSCGAHPYEMRYREAHREVKKTYL